MNRLAEDQPTPRALLATTERAFSMLWQALSRARPDSELQHSFDAVIARLILSLAQRYACDAGLPREALSKSQLAALAEPIASLGPLEQLAYLGTYEQQLKECFEQVPALRVFDIAAAYESLLALPGVLELPGGGNKRAKKQTGSYYTPPALARRVVELALEGRAPGETSALLELRVLDPAVGAGVFLIEACHVLADKLTASCPDLSEREALARVARSCLYGVDSNRLSLAVAEACLWLTVADAGALPHEFSAHLKHGDSLVGYALETGGLREMAHERLAKLMGPKAAATAFDFGRVFEEAREGFDWVIGNPPWVAYAGRSAQPLPPKLRAYYSESFAAWRGFPTLHALFVERAASLAPKGSVALLLPSPLADLEGYRGVRTKLTSTHRVREGLPEFGQDAFTGVTQPCFALLADASSSAQAAASAFSLSERQRAGNATAFVAVPEVLSLLRSAPCLPPAHFGEMGFQTSRVASETLLLRAELPDQTHQLPLLEGRNVSEFSQGPPRLFLRADPALLKQAKCRLRSHDDYQRVDFVVRQTAPVPIAALHGGLAFRNSLLGGFASAHLSARLLVALLNSSLYRALHLAGQRDARQAAFPQVKVGHLRALPLPPRDEAIWASLEQLTQTATDVGMSDDIRAELDLHTFRLFAVPPEHQASVLAFLEAGAPRYAPKGVSPAAIPAPTASLDPVRRAVGMG